jgi:hypothetical protein
MKSQQKQKRGHRLVQQSHNHTSAAIEEHLLRLGVGDPLLRGELDREQTLSGYAVQCCLQQRTRGFAKTTLRIPDALARSKPTT